MPGSVAGREPPRDDVAVVWDGAALEVLARAGKPITGRQVHRLARRGSIPGVATVLERLTETGIVTAERAGSAILYEANRDHLAWPAVETLVGIRSALLQRLGDLLASWDHLRKQAALYGSAARADVDTLRVAVQRWTGNHAQRVVISESAWKKMANDGDPLVGSVRRDGIDLIGQSEAVA